MRDVVVMGVGMTPFGKFPHKSLKDLAREACREALKDGGIPAGEIEAGYCANALGGVLTGQTMVSGQVLLRETGIVGVPIVNCENACSSGSTALREAWIAIGAGMCDTAIVLGTEKLYTQDTQRTVEAIAGAGDVELELNIGVNFPAHWALRATRRMELYGTKPEHYAMVSEKNHRNGCHNPRSQYRKETPVDMVLGSRMIATPLTQLQCSPIGDGAAAVILCAADKAKKHTTKPVYLAGIGMASGTYRDDSEICYGQVEENAARQAYGLSGIGPGDIGFAEVHDCFTIAEFMRVEGLGLFGRGEYEHALARGHADIGGRLPINPSGGLLAKGHPISATGVAQICEVVWQMRGSAGARQVGNTKTGLAHCSGGGIAGDGAVAVVSVLKRGW